MLNIKTYIQGISIWSFILLSMIFASCSEESPSSHDFEVPEGMVGVTFSIPDYDGGAAQFGTRAFDPKEEGYMSNLYIIGVKYANIDDNGNETPLEKKDRIVYTFSLNPVGENFQKPVDGNNNGIHEDVEKDYHIFNVALYPGKYKFGLLANVDLYLWRAQKISDFTKEEDLENLVLYFSQDTPLVPYHLPMACLPNDIYYTDVDNPTKKAAKDEKDNLITITKERGTHIWADMTFLCSKVRYTILFDKTPGGISEAFGNSWIRFNVDDNYRPIATNLRSYTELMPEVENKDKVKVDYDFVLQPNSPSGNSNDDSKVDGYTGSTYSANRGWWSMNIGRYQWQETEGEDYPKKPSSELKLWSGSADSWIESPQKVWQGIVYLPENLNDKKDWKEEVIKTVLEFPYHTRINSLEETPEVEADKPKQIYLFGNPNEEQYQGTTEAGDYTSVIPDKVFDGIQRNYMYDIVAKVVNPDVEPMDIRVFVSILPWHNVDQTIDQESNTNPSTSNTSQEKEVGYKPNPWESENYNNQW